jgi:non-specific serine/threonine protein kinase
VRLLGNSTGRKGEVAKAIKLLERALEIGRPLDVPRLTTAILSWLGFYLAYQGEHERGHRVFEEALRLMREVGDPARMPLINFAELQFADGDIAGAIASARTGVAIQREVGLGSQMATGSNNLAAYLLAAGELREAWVAARAALDLSLPLARLMGAAISMQHLVQIAARRGQTETAARLIGYVDAVYAIEKHPREPTERHGHERILALLHAAYGEARIAGLAAEGAALSEPEAVALACSIPQPEEGS